MRCLLTCKPVCKGHNVIHHLFTTQTPTVPTKTPQRLLWEGLGRSRNPQTEQQQARFFHEKRHRWYPNWSKKFRKAHRIVPHFRLIYQTPNNSSWNTFGKSKQMTTRNSFILVCLSLTILIVSDHSLANQTQPNLQMEKFSGNIYGWMVHYGTETQKIKLKMGAPMVMTGILCFIAASISSAGGIGGGGLFIPILTILAGLDLKTATSFSALMVTGGSTANVIFNLFTKSAKFGGKSLIDYDIALLSEPCMLLGVGAGVICNRVFPEWLITILFVVFLAWSTFKTCRNGVLLWKFESEQVMRYGIEEVENGVVRDGDCSDGEVPLLGMQRSNKLGFPWMKVCILVMFWFAFFALYLLRGIRNGQVCGGEYWILSSLQIPLAIVFTAWILCILRRKESNQHQTPKQQDTEYLTSHEPPSRLIFPIMALMAGLLGGVFGIGGGMLISPFLLQVGVPAEVTAATCSFMVFFSSTMSAFQYLFLGMENTDTALIFAVICFVASLIGLMVVQGAIRTYGRASLIVFSVSLVMALSTIFITSFGALDVWQAYESGNYMGFKSPC